MRPLPAPHWRVINDAVLAPPIGDGPPRCGAFDANGQFCPDTRTLLSHGRLSDAPDHPLSIAAHLPGAHFYGGLGRMHFGHFLVESAPRFWALDQMPMLPDSVIFLPLAKANMRADLNAPIRELYTALTGALPIEVVKAPLRVDQLIVAQQGFGHGDWLEGTETFRTFIARRLADTPPFNGPEKIYISRRKLKAPEHRVDQEAALEDHLAAAGYAIIHPESLDLGTQIETYRAAQVILGGDGSAFHLLAFVVQPRARVGLIQRRNRPEVVERLARQIRAFSQVTVDRFDPTLPLSAQRRLVPKGAKAPVPIDLAALLADLRSAGYL